MSYRVYLVACKTHKVLHLGKVLHDESGVGFGFDQTLEPNLGDAVLRFIANHARDDVVVMPESKFWDQDLTDHENVDADYGLNYVGPRWYFRRES